MDRLEQLMKLSLGKKLAILVLFCALVGLVYFYLYHEPLAEELENLKNQHTQLVAQRQEAQARKATYERDLRKRDELKKTYSMQLKALPPDAEIASFLGKLNEQSELVGLDILSVKPKEEEPEEYYARIPVELKLRGGFHQLAKFFYLVGNLDRIINIEDIRLNVVNVEEQGAQLEAQVLATTFRALSAEDKGKKKLKRKKR